MQSRPRDLLVLHPDRDFVRRLGQVTGPDLRLRLCTDWEDLGEAVLASPAASLVVVDPRHDLPPGGGIAPELRSLVMSYPSAPVLAALAVGAGAADDLRALGRLGVVEILTLGHDDVAPALRCRLLAAGSRPLKRLLREVLPTTLPGRVRALVDTAAEVVVAGQHGRDLADRLGLSRRTLLRWTDRSQLPPPRKLLAWMRILLAAALLDDPGRTVLSAAQAAGYSSDSGLRRITQRFLGLSPSEMRQRGAFAGASKRFVESLECRRERMPGGDGELPEP